jgi:hypothetical protein
MECCGRGDRRMGLIGFTILSLRSGNDGSLHAISLLYGN